MRILQVHNCYQQAGGEDQVVAAEEKLLNAHGHTVIPYRVHNDAVKDLSAARLGLKTIWNGQTYSGIRRLIKAESVDLLHAHNTLPLISPAVYWAAAADYKPVVQTLHNYRLLCPAATLYRQGQICQLCVDKTVKFPAVKYSCYRGSTAASGAVCAMLAAHHWAGTFERKVNTYIALTEFARGEFCKGGMPAGRVEVKPNFLMEDPGVGAGDGGYALFAGRLTEEKGLTVLLDAWSKATAGIRLKIAGDGPMQGYVRERAAAIAGVEFLGACDHDRVLELLKQAAFLVFPSRWFEGMPMIILEAMACGTPVVGFGLGSMNDLIEDGINGVQLKFDDPNSLPDFLETVPHRVGNLKALRSSTRRKFEENFTAERNYELLVKIYQRSLS